MRILLTKTSAKAGTLFIKRNLGDAPEIAVGLLEKSKRSMVAYQFEAVVRFAGDQTARDVFSLKEVGFFSPPGNKPAVAIPLGESLPPEVYLDPIIKPVKGPNVWLFHRALVNADMSDGVLVYVDDLGRPFILDVHQFPCLNFDASITKTIIDITAIRANIVVESFKRLAKDLKLFNEVGTPDQFSFNGDDLNFINKELGLTKTVDLGNGFKVQLEQMLRGQ